MNQQIIGIILLMVTLLVVILYGPTIAVLDGKRQSWAGTCESDSGKSWYWGTVALTRYHESCGVGVYPTPQGNGICVGVCRFELMFVYRRTPRVK